MMRKKIADIEKSAILYAKSTSAKRNSDIKISSIIKVQVGIVDNAKERQVKGWWFKSHDSQDFFFSQINKFSKIY